MLAPCMNSSFHHLCLELSSPSRFMVTTKLASHQSCRSIPLNQRRLLDLFTHAPQISGERRDHAKTNACIRTEVARMTCPLLYFML